METEIFKKCRGYTLKLTHPSIKKGKEYQIRAFKIQEGKYGEFFILYCYLPELDIYQRVFSNSKLSQHLLIHKCTFWTRYEPCNKETENIMVWNDKMKEIMKFYPEDISEYNGMLYRKIIFDISEP